MFEIASSSLKNVFIFENQNQTKIIDIAKYIEISTKVIAFLFL
jgi:hypothetical protein